MRKIPTMFARDFEGSHQVFDQVTPGCEWVLAGEGEATRKFDGTACLAEKGVLWKRREIKPGGSIPPGFREEEHDEKTGKRFGWTPVSETDPGDRYHREVFARCEGLEDGTYELVGPKIQGGAEPFEVNRLVRHGAVVQLDVPRTFDGLREYLEKFELEGIVFHHPDGRMAKIKRRDFGIPWPVKRVPVA